MASIQSKLVAIIHQNLGFSAGAQQNVAIEMLAQYCTLAGGDEVFLLSGYAGTGKTSLVGALVKTLPEFRMRVTLLAPTGRAAKVLSAYSGRKAYTIHKHIYMPTTVNGKMEFVAKENKAVRTLFIVDEASMISDDDFSGGSGVGSSSLLEDLLLFVSEGEGCKLLIVGDTAQLPPVKQVVSPALDPAFLERRYGLHVRRIELTEVMRQASASSVLTNATHIRELLRAETPETPKLITGKDTVRLRQSYEVMDAMNDTLGKGEVDESVVIVRSNKRANLFNRDIRARVQFKETDLESGDHLMVVRNNYFWLAKESEAGFIANGDVALVQRIHHKRERYGFHFAEATVQLVDYPDEKPLEVTLLLDTLTSEGPSLTWEDNQLLYANIYRAYEMEGFTKSKIMRMMKEDPYMNALQVKFAYAVTCHKAQGGQWRNVILEQAWLPEGVNHDYLRWLYTAFTRATEKVYLLGFPDEFFENPEG